MEKVLTLNRMVFNRFRYDEEMYGFCASDGVTNIYCNNLSAKDLRLDDETFMRFCMLNVADFNLMVVTDKFDRITIDGTDYVLYSGENGYCLKYIKS